MIGQEDGMFMFLSKKLKREQGSPLNEAQRALAPSISKEGAGEAEGFIFSPPSSPIPVQVRRGEAVTA
jgi:hypothetical protein